MTHALPKPNASFLGSDTSGAVSEDGIRGLICNPVYAGLGPFPAMVTDEQWIRAAAKLIAAEGAEQFLVNLLSVLRETFPAVDGG